MSTSKYQGYLPPNAFVMGRRVSTLPARPKPAASVPASDSIATTKTEDSTAAVPAAAVAVSPAPDARPAAPAAIGEGNPRAELIFVGGLDERKGPGPNGPLLDKMIEAMGRKRAQVYITPVLSPVDAVRCVEAIGPKVVVALGKSAAQNLAKAPLPESVQLLSTPHPDEMVTNPAAKKEAWEQLKIAMKCLGWQR